jgi:Rieske Fe-S protein
MRRRRALEWIVATASALLGVVVAAPAAALLSFPARKKTISGADAPVDVGAVDKLPEGTPVRVTVTAPRRRDAWTAFTDVILGSAWLLRSGNEVRALSTVCPHAGCAVDWDANAASFVCPCHDSRFAKDGTHRSGPSPRPMDALECDVRDGRVHVVWQRFKTATSKKEPV